MTKRDPCCGHAAQLSQALAEIDALRVKVRRLQGQNRALRDAAANAQATMQAYASEEPDTGPMCAEVGRLLLRGLLINNRLARGKLVDVNSDVLTN